MDHFMSLWHHTDLFGVIASSQLAKREPDRAKAQLSQCFTHLLRWIEGVTGCINTGISGLTAATNSAERSNSAGWYSGNNHLDKHFH